MRATSLSLIICSVKKLLLLCVLSTLSFAADYKDATIVELRDATEVGTAEVTNTNTVGPYAKDVPAMVYRCYLTVEIDHEKYSAVFPVNQHFRLSDLNTGDTIAARIEGNKLVIRTPDGKQMKSKIVNHSASK
jgi:hypothetical protein